MGVLLTLTKEYFGEIERAEDKFETNIKDLKEVDLGKDFPLIFANEDLIVNGENKFDWYFVESILDKIKKTGWDLPPYKGFDSMFYKSTYPHIKKDNIKSKWIPYEGGIIETTDSNEKLIFRAKNKEFGEDYWCGADKDLSNSKTARSFNMGDTGFSVIVVSNNQDKYKKCKIRLIKYKFPDEEFFK